jgi:hypothetical protein
MSRDPDGQLVEREFLTLPVWDRLDAQTAETVARAVEQCLPEPWTFRRVAWHECGDQKRHVAFFDWNGAEFALVPGGEMTLGYDPEHPFVATTEQQWDWESGRYFDWEGHRHPTPAAFLYENTTPLRAFCAPALLAEVQPLAWHRELDDEDDSGWLTLSERLATDGFRLPTADEWEHLCRAGTRTVWRWGDSCPLDNYPYPPYPRHDRADRLPYTPNAIGLVMTDRLWQPEWVDDWRDVRGNDGGAANRYSAGTLAVWLTLASAYWPPSQLAKSVLENALELFYRRIFPLPETMFG